jgi:predicted ATPase/class 3 adenylate cyclase
LSELPTGTVTFLFTDIEGSTRLLQRLGEQYPAVLADHHRVLRTAIEGAGGREVSTEGDSFFVVFPTAPQAVTAAVAMQRKIAEHPWPGDGTVRVRMGLHSGEAVVEGGTYVGLDVHRAARIAAAAHGDQVVLSSAAKGLIEHALPEGVRLRDLGEHRLKDLSHPEHVFQLVIEGLASDFPPLRSLDARPNNLPVQATTFVGRERELAECRRLLDGSRLLTLTGPGGTGKTRLALQVAADALTDFADGAFIAALGTITDAGLVPSTIAEALGVHEEPARPLMESLRGHLSDKEVLLLLDNFEQVIEAAPLLSELLGGAPRLKTMVTSREVLGLYGEQEFPVPPLSLPDPRRLPDISSLSQYEAVGLFIERAVAARPDFAVTNQNAPAVAEICVRLDGLPLAIELAAAWIKILSPEAILSRLDRRLELLTRGARDLPPRQRSLRGAIEWSYNLLEPSEQRLFERLSVFIGGCPLEAIEAVCTPEELGIDPLEGLSSLVDKSLVRQEGTEGLEPRFVMLETIREYGLERLRKSADAEAVPRRHATFYMTLAEEAEQRVTGEDQRSWLDRLDAEHDNFRAALGWALESGQAEVGLRMAGALWRFWQQRGHLSEGRRWTDELLGMPAAAPATRVRAKALGAAGSLSYWQNDYPAARARYEEALAVSREVGDSRAIAEAIYNLAFMPWIEGDDAAALALFDESLSLFRELDDRDHIATVAGNVALIRGRQGDYERALPLMEESIATARETGNRFLVADGLIGVAQLYHLAGDDAAAHSASLESLVLFREAENPSGVAATLETIGALESFAGRFERAIRLAGAASSIKESIGGGAPPELLDMADPREQARDGLSEEAIETVWNEGRAMTIDEAVAYALEENPTLSSGLAQRYRPHS